MNETKQTEEKRGRLAINVGKYLPDGFDRYDYGLCPACGVWQQLMDWNGTHRLGCPAHGQRPPRLLLKAGTGAYRMDFDALNAALGTPCFACNGLGYRFGQRWATCTFCKGVQA